MKILTNAQCQSLPAFNITVDNDALVSVTDATRWLPNRTKVAGVKIVNTMSVLPTSESHSAKTSSCAVMRARNFDLNRATSMIASNLRSDSTFSRF